jgi:uncharacterized protein (TIGR02996 family)
MRKQILAAFDAAGVHVHQAFKPSVVEAALVRGTFGGRQPRPHDVEGAVLQAASPRTGGEPRSNCGPKRRTVAMIQEEAFIQHIQAHPDDAGLRLIYADWLEERNDPRAAFLRAEAELAALPKKNKRRVALRARLREMAREIDPDWLAAIDRAPVENCGHDQFEFECPKRWEELKPTGEGTVRFCEDCKKNVYYCGTVGEARLHTAEGHCVAVDSRQERTRQDVEPPRLRMGRMLPWTGDRLRVGDLVYLARDPDQRRGVIEEIDAWRKTATVRVLDGRRSKFVEASLDSLWGS